MQVVSKSWNQFQNFVTQCVQDPVVAGANEIQHSELFDEMIDSVAAAVAYQQSTSQFLSVPCPFDESPSCEPCIYYITRPQRLEKRCEAQKGPS